MDHSNRRKAYANLALTTLEALVYVYRNLVCFCARLRGVARNTRADDLDRRQYSIAQGRRANIPLVAAVALGDSTALIFSLLGLGAVLAASAFWFTVIKWIGGLYLLYMGIRLLRAGISSAQPVTPTVSGSRLKLFTNTYLVTALNPKGIIFFVAFLPQFVSPDADAGQQLWILAVTFVVLATLNATLYAVFATSVRKMLASRRAQRRFNIVGGTLLSSAGIWALLAKRPA